MSGFKFRLEKVWRHRRRLVDRHSVEVAQADRRVAHLSRRLTELEGDIGRQARSMVPPEGEKVYPRDLISGTAWLDHLHVQKESLEGELQTALRDLERFRCRLTESFRDLEVLSRLKEKQKDDWRHDSERAERRQMDEIGQIRAHRHGVTKISH